MRTTHWAFAAARSEILVSENRGRARITRPWKKKSTSNTQSSLSYPFTHTHILFYTNGNVNSNISHSFKSRQTFRTFLKTVIVFQILFASSVWDNSFVLVLVSEYEEL